MIHVNRKSHWVAVFFAGLFFACTNLQAETDSLIMVGIYQNPPKIYFDENKKPAGIFIELLEEIARLENWQLNYVSCTWNDCLLALENGEIDLLPDVAYTFDRSQRFGFNTIPVIESWSQVYANPDLPVTQLSDLKGKNIALVESSMQQPLFHQIMNGFGYPFHEVRASSFPDAFSMVKIGVADAAVVNYFFGEAQYKSYNLIKTPVIFNPAILHFAVNDSENEWITKTIDNYLTEWKQTPESFYYKTLKKYIHPVGVAEEPHVHLLYFLLIAGILLTGIFLYLFLRTRFNRQTKELVKAIKQLRYEEKKFRSYIDHAPHGIFIANEHGKYVDVNPTVCKLTGYKKQELIGKNIPDIIEDEGKIKALNHYKAVTKEGKATVIIPYLTKNSERRLWKVTVTTISANRFIGFVEDVTEDTKMRNRLQMMSKIFDQSVNEIYLFDIHDYHFVQVNEAVISNTGYAAWELEKMTPFDLKINLSPEQFDALIQPLLKKEKKSAVLETPHYRKDGTFYNTEVYLQLLEIENEKVFSAVVLDITDRRNKEKELQQIQERLEKEVNEKTRELNKRIAELENFREATIERELRMEELRNEIERLKNEQK
jgi:PAS domain S-box-containing protein